jgi:LAGLIDADG endonuclease
MKKFFHSHSSNNLDKFFQWFVGFSDAEGNFQMYPKKRILKSGEIIRYNVGYAYHLSLHKRDTNILKYIRNKLSNIGTIYEYLDKSDSRLAINDISGLLYLMNNVFDIYPLIVESQLTRYLLLRSGLINEVKEFETLEQYNQYKTKCLLSISEQIKSNNNIKKLFDNSYLDNWIIGFINGEGCFYMNKNKCNFYIEHTDRQALEIIKRRLSFGPNVLERSPRNKDFGKKRKTTYQLIISSKKDIENLIIFLDDKDNIPLQGNKYTQYIKWKQLW